MFGFSKGKIKTTQTVIMSDEKIPEDKIRKVIEDIGYTLTAITSI